MVRQNRTKNKLNSGQVAFGVSVGINDVEFAELSGALDFDFVIVDCEHELFSSNALLDMIRAVDVYGLTVIVRTQNNPERILHALDSGAQGILVARVNSKEEAQIIVNAAKFYPEGKRTIYYRGRGGNFGLDITSAKQWTEDMNSQILIACIVEEITGVNNLDEILSVPSIDMIDLGPLDLAHSLGWPPQAEVDKLVDKIVSSSCKAGKTVLSGGDISTMQKSLEKGFRAFHISPRSYFQAGAPLFLRDAKTLANTRNFG